jgi:two-component system phosphate regulon response regulator PhoB
MAAILVVDDDPAIREMVRLALMRAGHEVQEAGSVLEARESISNRAPDLMLLDWMLPGQSGFDFARALRGESAHSGIPIIMLTARAQEMDRVTALDAGADDYVSKPFSISELIARIGAVLRRTGQQESSKALETDSLRLDPASRRVSIDDTPLELAPMEFELLLFFMSHPERAYNRQQLIDLVWGSGTYVEERTVDVHIRRLRKSLEPTGHDRLIQTVRGTGYRFSAQAA